MFWEYTHTHTHLMALHGRVVRIARLWDWNGYGVSGAAWGLVIESKHLASRPVYLSLPFVVSFFSVYFCTLL